MKTKKELKDWLLNTSLVKFSASFYYKSKKFIISLYWYNLFCPTLYTSIYDTPAYLWEEFLHSKDENVLLDMIKNPKKRNLKWFKSHKIIALIEFLYRDSIEKFPPKEYLKQLELKARIAIYRFKAISEDKRALRTKANLLELQLKKPTQKIENNFYENCLKIGRILGTTINSRTISIFEYNNNCAILSKDNVGK